MNTVKSNTRFPSLFSKKFGLTVNAEFRSLPKNARQDRNIQQLTKCLKTRPISDIWVRHVQIKFASTKEF